MTWNKLFEESLEREGSILANYTSGLVTNWYFVSRIKKYINAPSKILEAGAGTGNLSIYLASLGHEVYSVDVDTKFIEKSNQFFKFDIAISNQNIIELDFDAPVDLIFNIGVMEHFKDEDIIKIFKKFHSFSPLLIFAIPNFKIPDSFGDERYLSKRKWKKLLKDSGWQVKEKFSFCRYRFRNYLTGFACTHTIK